MSAGDRAAGKRRAVGPNDDLPAPVAEVLDLLAGESAASRTFLGGLVLGALFGAALAGGSAARRGMGEGIGRRIGRRIGRGRLAKPLR